MVRLKGVHKSTAKGKTYFYAWRGGPRLLGDPRTNEDAARQYFDLQRRKSPKSTLVVAALLRYQESPEFERGRSRKWHMQKRKFMEMIAKEFGDDDMAIFNEPKTAGDIIDWRDSMRATPRKADHAVGELSTFLNWCRRRGLVTHNLASGVEKIGVADWSDVIWTEEEIAALEPHASIDIMAAVRLAAVTGLSRGDLLALRWSDVQEVHIGPVARRKTGQLAVIPRFPEVNAALSLAPRRAAQVLTNSYGRPWTADSFSTAFRRVKLDAKIDKRFHDFRGTAVTFLYRQGLNDDEVADIIGWAPKNCRMIRRRYVTPQAVAEGIILKLARPALKEGTGE